MGRKNIEAELNRKKKLKENEMQEEKGLELGDKFKIPRE